MKVLVDTSVWSLALRRKRPLFTDSEQRITAHLADLIAEKKAMLVGPVRQQLLSGCRTPGQFTALRDQLRGFVEQLIETFDYELAAEIANQCIHGGVAVSDVDLLLCAIAVRRNWPIFTTDKDFARYQKFCPLKLHKA